MVTADSQGTCEGLYFDEGLWQGKKEDMMTGNPNWLRRRDLFRVTKHDGPGENYTNQPTEFFGRLNFDTVLCQLYIMCSFLILLLFISE